jgi:hypothetical protein
MNNFRVDPARRVWRYILARLANHRAKHEQRCRKRADALILETPPTPVDPAAEIEIHSLTCEKDYLDLLWCIKTFHYFSARPCNIVIHDDGSLSPKALDQLYRHLPGTTIISRTQADERMRDVLRRHPACQAFRERLPLARRVFDFPTFACRDRFLILDSDVLFFRRPDAMLHAIDCRRLFFMSDYQDGYISTRPKLASRYGVDIMPRFNTGISCLGKEVFDLDFIEQYSKDVESAGLRSHPWAEQTLFALLLSRHGDGVERLPDVYAISRTSISATTVSHHYVNDGSRAMFYTQGVPHLRRTTFIPRLLQKVR